MNVQFNKSYENLKSMNLDELLDEISVMHEWSNDTRGIDDWYAVATDLGIIAYFGSEHEAYRFRLDYINRILNY